MRVEARRPNPRVRLEVLLVTRPGSLSDSGATECGSHVT